MSPSTRTEFTLLPEVLEARAAAAPRAVALVVDGQGSLTYGAWNREADRLAGGLIARGTKPGDVVGLHFSLSAWLDYAIAYFGVQKAGAVAMPFRSDTPQADLAEAMEHCDGRALLTDAGAEPPFGPWWVASPSDLDGPSAGAVRAGRKPTDLAEILHTSGTTGRAKAVTVSHESLLYRIADPAHRPSRRPSCLHAMPFGTDVGDLMLLEPLTPGMSRTVVMPAFEPKGFYALIDEWRIRDVTLVPAMAIRLVESGACGSFDLGSVRRITLTGSRTPDWLPPRLLTLFPRATIRNAYTSTEAWPAATSTDFDPARPGSVGRPRHGADIRIVDAVGQEARPMERGEVWLRSLDVSSRSYVNDRDASAGTFVDGWVRTGDIGYLDHDRYLYLVGRKEDVIDVGGTEVVPTEIETVLESFPGVVEAAAFGIADQAVGEQTVAVVLVRSGSLDTSELTAWARARLGFAKAPRAVFLVDELPRNASGKVLRRHLRESFRFQAPTSRPPEPGLEAELACIWNRALGVDVGTDDDFFSRGGHSLAAIEIAVEAGKHFGFLLSIASVYEYPTVALLAKHIESVMTDGPGSMRTLTAMSPNGAEPPALRGAEPAGVVIKGPATEAEQATQRWWAEAGGGSSSNLVVLSERVSGVFDVRAFRRAFNALVARHDALRTSYVAEGEEVYRVVTPHSQPPFDVVDVTSFRRSREARVRHLVEHQTAKPFPPEEPYRTNAAVYVLGDEDHVIQVMVDHLVTDDWSVQVMRSDLSALYVAELDGAEPELPPRVVTYHDTVMEEERWLASDEVKDLGELRAARLRNFPWSHDLPVVDFDGPPTYFDLHHKTFGAPELLQARVYSRAAELRASPFALVMAAFCALLHRYTGQSDHIVITQFSGREDPRHKDVVGLFHRWATVRVSTGGDPTYRELVKRTQQAELSAFADARAPSQSSGARRALFLQQLPSRVPIVRALTAPQPTPSFSTARRRWFEPTVAGGDPQAHVVDEADDPELAGLAGPLQCSPNVGLSLYDRKGEFKLRLSTYSDPDLVEVFLSHFQRVLAAFVEAPETHLSDVGFLDAHDLSTLGRVNDSQGDDPGGDEAPCLGGLTATEGMLTVRLAAILKPQGNLSTASRIALAPGPPEQADVELLRIAQQLDVDVAVVPPDIWDNAADVQAYLAENAVSVLCADVRQLAPEFLEALSAEGRRRAEKGLDLLLWGPDMPTARLWHALQAAQDTLSTTWVWTPLPSGRAAGWSDLSCARRRPTVERAATGVRMAVVDADGNIVPPGPLGRIVVEPETPTAPAARSGRVNVQTAVATGYLGRYLLDGAVQLVSPEEDFARWRGFPLRFSLVEEALCEHEAISDAAVVIHTPPGEEDEVVALVVCEREMLRVRDLLVSLTEAFPGMPTPTSLRAVDRLPAGRTKADRLALRQMVDIAEECRDPVEPLTPAAEWVLKGLVESGLAAEADEPIYLLEGLRQSHLNGLIERLNDRGVQVELTDLRWWTTARDVAVWIDQGGPQKEEKDE